MSGYCTFRVDAETEQLIGKLVNKTFRTRSGLMRLLVHLAAKKPELLGPDLAVLVEDKDGSLAEQQTTGEPEVLG